MTVAELVQSLRENAALVTGVSAALIVLWRYVANPFRKVLKSLKQHSEEIYHFLPLLSAGRDRWPSSSGPGSFLRYIDKLDERVAHSECRTEVILDLSPQPIYECSPDGECTFANEKLCDLFGLSEVDMMGNGWLDGILPEERERVHSIWIAAVKNLIPYECSYTVRNLKNGKRYNAVTRALPLHNEGELIGYLGILSKIEEIKKGNSSG